MFMHYTPSRSTKSITPDCASRLECSPAAPMAHGWGEGDLAPAFFAQSLADYLPSFMGAPQQFPALEDVFPHFAHLYCAMPLTSSLGTVLSIRANVLKRLRGNGSDPRQAEP